MGSFSVLRFPKVTYWNLSIFWPILNLDQCHKTFLWCNHITNLTLAFYGSVAYWKQTDAQNLNCLWHHRKNDFIYSKMTSKDIVVMSLWWCHQLETSFSKKVWWAPTRIFCVLWYLDRAGVFLPRPPARKRRWSNSRCKIG